MSKNSKMAARTKLLIPANIGAVAALVVAGSVFSLLATTNVMAADPYAGRQVYQNNCAMCHKTGLNAAPKYGNKRAWTPIIEQGKEKVYENSLNGKGAMPPRGGKPNLTDQEVKDAVNYMVGAAGGWPD